MPDVVKALRVTTTLIVAGSIESFDRTTFVSGLGALLGVATNNIDLVLSSASVRVNVTMTIYNATRGQRAVDLLRNSTSASMLLSETLGVQVEDVQMPTVQEVVVTRPQASQELPKLVDSDEGSALQAVAVGWSLLIIPNCLLALACVIGRRWLHMRELRKERDESIKVAAERRESTSFWVVRQPPRPKRGAEPKPADKYETASTPDETEDGEDEDAFDALHRQLSPSAKAVRNTVAIDGMATNTDSTSAADNTCEVDASQKLAPDAEPSAPLAQEMTAAHVSTLTLADLQPRTCRACDNVLSPWARFCSLCGEAQSPHVLRPPVLPPLTHKQALTLTRLPGTSCTRSARVAPMSEPQYPPAEMSPRTTSTVVHAVAPAAADSPRREAKPAFRPHWIPKREPHEFRWDYD